MATDVNIVEIPLADIVIDPDLQPREKLHTEMVTQYAEDMLQGISFPPLRIFRVTDRENRLHLTSGFHRCHAAQQCDRESIVCELYEGTYTDAKWDAAGSNIEWDSVGIRRTSGDVKRAIQIAWEALGCPVKKRITEIADHVRADKSWVSRCVADFVAKQHSFNVTNENVDWAKWTWNPVTGCEHTCVYCYARDIANRFYKEKFVPTFHPDRLQAPKVTKLPGRSDAVADPIIRTAWRNVFVCSMADLFGRWVPDEWITSVFDSCRQSPQWNYLFLTKFPQRYTGLDFPTTSWVGTTVDEQKRVANAEKAFRKIEVPVKWLSVEPMLEPLEFTDLRMFDWVVIGGQSKSSGAPEFFPDKYWVNRLIDRAHAAGCAVYCKPNTDAPGWWARLFKEYPSAFSEAPPDGD